MNRWSGLAALLLPGLVLAEQAAAPAPMPTPGSASQLGQLALGLLLVIGLIFVLAWLVRRVQSIVPRGGRVIRLLATQALGPRDRLLLVQVGKEQILLGLSAGRITPLHVLREPVEVEDEPAPGEFAQRLKELLRQQKDAGDHD